MIVLAAIRDRLLAADPGMTRLLLAARVTLAVALTVLAVAIEAAALDEPITVAILGAIVAMQASLAINDDEPQTTTLLAPVPGMLGIGLGAVFAARGLLADIVFLAVLFGAVAVRTRGPRWTAFGTIAMMTYFSALFLDATVAQLPALVGAILIAVGLTYAVRFLLLPERPKWIARRTIDAFDARIRFVALASRELLETRDAAPARRRLSTALEQLNETATSIEGRLGTRAIHDMRRIFDAELAAEELAAGARALWDTAAHVPHGLVVALAALAGGHAERAGRVAARIAHDTEHHSPAVRSLATSVVDLSEAIERVDAATASLALSDRPWGGGAGPQQPVLRQAIQVTAASGVAIAVGEWLSPQRWYWAVLATYFVFIGTASSGETFARAWSRIAGTALGVATGIIVGHLAQGHPWLAVGAIFACLFMGVYLLRISYMMMIFFITALLALLYSALGRFSDGLLGIRLIETAVGAICGGAAATIILPTRTRDVVRASAGEVLDAARAVAQKSIAQLVNPQSGGAALEAAQVLEERVQRFIARAKPATAAPALIGQGHELRRWIVSLNACSYYARLLARTADRAVRSPCADAARALEHLDTILDMNIDAAAQRIDGKHDRGAVDARLDLQALRAAAHEGTKAEPRLLAAAHLIERFDRAIARLARDENTITEIA